MDSHVDSKKEKEGMTVKRSYSSEFKSEAVDLAKRSEKSISQIERELGITPGLLNKWKRRAGQGSESHSNRGKSESELEAENRRLRRELEVVTDERDILKKTIAILAQQRSK